MVFNPAWITAGASILQGLGGALGGGGGGATYTKNMQRHQDKLYGEQAHWQKGLARMIQNRLFGRPLPETSGGEGEPFEFGELANRIFDKPENPYSDELLERARRRYMGQQTQDLQNMTTMARRQFGGRGLTNSGMYERQLGRLYEDARRQLGDYDLNMQMAQADTARALDTEGFNRAMAVLGLGSGANVNAVPMESSRSGGFNIGSLLGGLGGAAEEVGAYQMMRQLGLLGGGGGGSYTPYMMYRPGINPMIDMESPMGPPSPF